MTMRLGCMPYRTFVSRSAMRVCQPGPLAFQRSRTSSGRRIVINLRGLVERGRPPFFTTARDKAFEESSGSSLYSCGRIACASTRPRSDFKVRRETGLFTIIRLSHAEYVAHSTTRCVADYDEAPSELAVADDSRLAVVPSRIFDLDGGAFEYHRRVLEVESAIGKSLGALRWIVGDTHQLL